MNSGDVSVSRTLGALLTRLNSGIAFHLERVGGDATASSGVAAVTTYPPAPPSSQPDLTPPTQPIQLKKKSGSTASQDIHGRGLPTDNHLSLSD